MSQCLVEKYQNFNQFKETNRVERKKMHSN